MTGGIGFSRDAQSALKTNRANRDQHKENQVIMGKSMTQTKSRKRSHKKKHTKLQIDYATKGIQDHYRVERFKQIAAFLITSIILIWLIFVLF